MSGAGGALASAAGTAVAPDKKCSLSWLETCLSETLLPTNPAWDDTVAKLEALVRTVVAPKLGNPVQRQVLFELLGVEFVREHFPSVEDNPLLLEEPLLPAATRRNAALQVRRWLKTEVSQAIVSTGLLMSPEFQRFEAYARERVAVGLDRVLEGSRSLEADIAIVDDNAAQLLTQVPQLTDILLPRLLGRSLPDQLRKLFWSRSLAYDKSVIAHKVTCSGLADPRRSPANGVIQRVVREQLASLPVFKRFAGPDSPAAVIADALNIVFVCTNVFEARFVLLAVPLLAALDAVDAQDLTVDVGASVLKLFEECGLAKSEVARAADRVTARVREADPALFAHLLKATANGAPDRQQILTGVLNSTAVGAGAGSLQHPTVFVRKWLGEAFVGIVREAALLFIWDQCVLAGWFTLEDFALYVAADRIALAGRGRWPGCRRHPLFAVRVPAAHTYTHTTTHPSAPHATARGRAEGYLSVCDHAWWPPRTGSWPCCCGVL